MTLHKLVIVLVFAALAAGAALAQSEPTPANDQVFDIEAGEINTTLDNGSPVTTTATGGVTVKRGGGKIGQGEAIKADRAFVDHRKEEMCLEGGVSYQTGAQTVYGDTLTINTRTREWSLTNSRTTITPQAAPSYLKQSVFAQGAEIDGVKSGEIDVRQGEATTCSLDHPHYDFKCRLMSLVPGRRIVMRNVTMYALGRRLYTIPLLVIPLSEQNNSRIVPLFGQSTEEGYYLKTTYAYTATNRGTGLARVDAMSKKGLGLGVDQNYKTAISSGELRVYGLRDRTQGSDTINGRINHRQTIKQGVTLGVSTDFRTNSYLYAPTTKTYYSQLTFVDASSRSTRTNLTFNQNINDSFTRTVQLSGSLRHNRPLGNDLSLDTSFDYTGYNATSSETRRLMSRLGLKYAGSKMDAQLTTQRYSDFLEGNPRSSGRFFGVEKLPELVVSTDDTKIGRFLPFAIPARIQLTHGKYLEMPAKSDVERSYLVLEIPNAVSPLGGSWRLSHSGAFRQYVYGNDTAQYSVEGNVEFAKTLGPKSKFTVDYRYQKPDGYTPLRFDYVGRYNATSLNLDMKDNQALRVRLTTGYDFGSTDYRWQDIVLKTWVQPVKCFTLYTSTAYNANQSRWQSLINQIKVEGGSGFILNLGTRYDTIRKKWSTIRGTTKISLGPLFRLEALGGYNGLSKRLDYSGVRLTRDLHCWEAALTYTNQNGFYKQNSIALELRIKAFPSYSTFGTGQFGEALGTSVGDVY